VGQVTHNQIARLAFSAAKRAVRVRHVPLPLASAAVRVLPAVSSQRVYGPAQFLAAVLSQDMVAPQVGSDHLPDDFISRAATEIFVDPPGRSKPEAW
jgi:hypothetical protein